MHPPRTAPDRRSELAADRTLILGMCAGQCEAAEGNLRDLALMRDEILEDIQSTAQEMTTRGMLLSIHVAVPTLRASRADRLPL